MPINKIKIKQILLGIFWMLIASSCIMLLVAAVRHKEAALCKGLLIDIEGINNNFFIDKNDVYQIIKKYGGDTTQQRSIASIDLKKIEKQLENDVWIKDAELYFDNNNILNVAVQERAPIARIFTNGGNTFYIDSSCKVLPLSEKFSARVPIFTGFATDAIILSKQDSSIVLSIKNLSTAINADPFLTAMIDQVIINSNATFDLVPKLGNQQIIFGEAVDIAAKFDKLKMFYKDVITNVGWNRYNIINLQYKNQVVAKIRGKEDVTADSLRTMELMQFIAADAAKRSADSSQIFIADADRANADSSLLQQSFEREEQVENSSPAFSNTAAVANTNKTPASTLPVTTSVKPSTLVKPAVVQKVEKLPAKPPPNKSLKTAQTKMMAKPVIKKAPDKKPVEKKTVIKKAAVTNKNSNEY